MKEKKRSLLYDVAITLWHGVIDCMIAAIAGMLFFQIVDEYQAMSPITIALIILIPIYIITPFFNLTYDKITEQIELKQAERNETLCSYCNQHPARENTLCKECNDHFYNKAIEMYDFWMQTLDSTEEERSQSS